MAAAHKMLLGGKDEDTSLHEVYHQKSDYFLLLRVGLDMQRQEWRLPVLMNYSLLGLSNSSQC